MTVYHFTSAKHMPLIATAGITKGVIPWSMKPNGEVGLVPGFQWCTVNNDWQQEWARPSPFSKLTYRRDEFRITIAIPESQRQNCVTWLDFCRKYQPQSAEFLNTFGDPHNWRVFAGRIPKEWFIQIDRNPTREDLIIPLNN